MVFGVSRRARLSVRIIVAALLHGNTENPYKNGFICSFFRGFPAQFPPKFPRPAADTM
jgi:hypothetical protein